MRGNGQTQKRSEVATISVLLNNRGGGGGFLPVSDLGYGSLSKSQERLLMFSQCIFPPVSLCVMFVTTWKLEAAALIETHPSPPTHSFSLFQNSLCKYREKKGRMKGREEKDGESA